jgi:hypothetical protein
MDGDKVVVGLALATAAGLGIYALTRKAEAAPTDTGSSYGGGFDGGGFDGGGYSGGSYGGRDPFTGQPIDPRTGLPTGLQEPPVFRFSPEAEAAIIDDNRRAADQGLADQRASLARIEDSAHTADAVNAALAAAATVPFAVGGAIKYGPALARGIGDGGRAILRNLAGVAPRLAAPGAGIAEFGALTATGAAVGAATGAAIGLGAVKVLQDTGGLDKVASAGRALGRATNAPAQTAIKSVALPLSLPGALVTAAVGRGSAKENLRSAAKGTVVAPVVDFLTGWL